MVGKLVRVLAGLLVAVVAAAAVLVAGMRTKSPPVVNAVRRFGRATRPMTIKSAGAAGSSTAAVHHVGRTTGRAYETPVVAVATDDGFLVALPYGTNTDWLKNVFASGSATIVHDGATYRVERPEVVPLTRVADQFSQSGQRAHRVFGVDECLQLRSTTAP